MYDSMAGSGNQICLPVIENNKNHLVNNVLSTLFFLMKYMRKTLRQIK